MKILIKSRKSIEKLARNPLPENTALISITDHGCDFADLEHKPAYLLKLSFDDVDGDVFEHNPTADDIAEITSKYHMLTDEQARQIAAFYNSVRGNAETLICQCEYGQSRSAAVAAAILEYGSHKGITIFAHEKYCPNKYVFHKIYHALQNK